MGNRGGAPRGREKHGEKRGKTWGKRAKIRGKHGEEEGGNRGELGEIQPTKPNGRVLAASGCRFFFLPDPFPC